MSIPELIYKHKCNMLSVAKIYGALKITAHSWDVGISTIQTNGDFLLYLTTDQEETAGYDFYKSHILKETLAILQSDNPELFA